MLLLSEAWAQESQVPQEEKGHGGEGEKGKGKQRAKQQISECAHYYC
jgi:hypothetical protein